MLPQILAIYGRPQEVLLRIYRDTPWVPFDLLLFYPEEGILVQYLGPAEIEREAFLACPHRTEITLWLWSPGQSMALEDIPNIGAYTADEISELRSLEEATGMDVGEFHRIFVSPDNQTCLETPADMW